MKSWASIERRYRWWIGAVVVAVVLFAGWRWHETHLPTPFVPSMWVYVDPSQDSATMLRWVITGRSISRIYTWDDLNNTGCIVAPVIGSINGHSVSLTVNFLNGSGSTQFSGTVDSSKLLLQPPDGGIVYDSYVPQAATSFVRMLAAMNYPPCGASSG
jgi:hypothetical protein